MAILFGYFLERSGSEVYVRSLARQLVAEGHDVTLVCQEPRPERFAFVDACHDVTAGSEPRVVFERPPTGAGRCRVVRVALGPKLLMYVEGASFQGFPAESFQKASDELIEDHVGRYLEALPRVFDRWPPELAQANHAIMQPFLAARTLPEGVPYVATVHGSALNYSVRADRRLVPYAREGLSRATAVAVLSGSSGEEVLSWAVEQGLDLAGRLVEIPPGVDTALFHPAERADALRSAGLADVDPEGDLLVYAGSIRWTKGIQHLVAALPLLARVRPRARLLLAGSGPDDATLRALVAALDESCMELAEEIGATPSRIGGQLEYGPVLPALGSGEREAYREAARGLGRRVRFLGHLEHGRLAPLLAAADLQCAPSVFPEAFGLVVAEGLAAGAVPLATCHSGLQTPLQLAAAQLGWPELCSLAPGVELTRGLAETAAVLLGRSPCEPRLRERLHTMAAREFSLARMAEKYLSFGPRPRQ